MIKYVEDASPTIDERVAFVKLTGSVVITLKSFYSFMKRFLASAIDAQLPFD
jgi:hypothetical protein